MFHSADHLFQGTEPEDHAHELERHWEIVAFPKVELLELAAQIFEAMNSLSAEAHEQLGRSLQGNYVGRRPPCMDDTTESRVARFEPRDATSVWTNEPPGLHHGE